MNFLTKILIYGLAVFLGVNYIPGIEAEGWGDIVFVSVVLIILQTFVRPILKILTFPITLVTLGLFSMIINVFIIYVAAFIVSGFSVDGFLAPLLFSLMLSIIVATAEFLDKGKKGKKK